MKLLAKMLALVAKKFQDKLDRQGKPYFLHCLHVMQTCGLEDENSLCIAVGHDLLEDIESVTLDFLYQEFNPIIANGINSLTHEKEQSYEDYIKEIGFSSMAYPYLAKIKLADLKHNMDASRLKSITAKDQERMIKYMKAYQYLQKV